MKVWTQWHCPGYSAPYDYEEFDSIAAAKDDFAGRVDDPYYPCVDDSEDGAEMLVWVTDPTESNDPYPDFSFRFGPRGGVVRCHC
jgi:hypothetical protein